MLSNGRRVYICVCSVILPTRVCTRDTRVHVLLALGVGQRRQQLHHDAT